nr:uncharacterized protein LOC113825188 [Penaeus vannamei]
MTNQRLNLLVIRADEVKYHLLETEVNKAFGPDNVSPYILKKCADQLATPLATLFQNCLNSKSGQLSGNRLEMTSFFDSNHLLSSKQFGFRSKRSASDLLLQLVTNWNKSLDAGKETYVVALDIAGARKHYFKTKKLWH